jgi:hypothetical protein
MKKEPSANYWTGWYAVVLLFLLLQIVLFTWITQHFN